MTRGPPGEALDHADSRDVRVPLDPPFPARRNRGEVSGGMKSNGLTKKMRQEFNFFASLKEEEVGTFLDFCENKSIPAGELLWKEGDGDNYAAFIVSGRLGIKKKTEFEGKHVIVGMYGKGTVVGELCLLTNGTRTVTAEIIEPAQLAILSSKNFEHLSSEHPLIGFRLLKQIFLATCKRLNKSYDRIAAIF
jgi:CRP-like cAMP-binding protein